ncbi:chitinase [Ceratobasidium sp. AG-Ba]|nr:chitinase [Ceratobasidium sp. AG-Ba]QRV91047.1 chitinase [Ceratobasidium sp. AG-Ba]
MKSKPQLVKHTAVFLLSSVYFGFVRTALVDLTSANRRVQVPGLPDWSKVGFEGGKPLPDDSKVAYTLSAAQLASQYGVVANDGQDDTTGLQNAIKAVNSQTVPTGSYRLIQLPAGTINLSWMIYVDTSYLIIRGAGSDPSTGTKIVFRPDSDTKYDKIINERWDLDGMTYDWDFPDDTANGPGPRVRGTATGGWLWPGRSIFRVGSSKVASKYTRQFSEAPRNRKELFMGSVNYHWRSDEGKTKGWMVSQLKDKGGVLGSSVVYVNVTNTTWVTPDDLTSTDVWIASPAKRNDFLSWGVVTQDWFVNSYIYQDWFTLVERGSDTNGPYYKLDRPLRFDVYRSSTGDGSTPMEDTETFAKAMPISHVVHHVGIESLYITHEIDGLRPEDAMRNYGNLAPEQAMHGIVFRFARDCWVRGIQTFMTGSHPVATEAARNIQIQDNYFDGAWNKGKGGNGYLRGSRVWDSLYYNNTMRNLRHITMQWCAMGNVVILNNMTNDMNLHGGWEGTNLFELNYVSVPYSHRSGSCSSCGGESGDQEPGTWFPIWWAAGEKASKWSGASGPQNVFYRNYMIKQEIDGGEYQEYRPYFAKDGSLSSRVWQLGWDSQSTTGIRYSHLSLENRVPITDWQGHEKVDYSSSPAYGANSFLEDPHTSLFLKDVSAAGGITSYSGVAGNTYCRGDVAPRVTGYYFASASRRPCIPFSPSVIDHTAFTHIMFAYGVLSRDGTISVAAEDQALLRSVVALKTKDSSLKVVLAVGGWGLGGDPSNMVAVATSASARTKLGTTGAALCSSYGLDDIDLEWASGISATQWNNIVQAAATGLGSYKLSMSTPHAFWSNPGINTVAASLARVIDFASLITHDVPGTTLEYMNALPRMSNTIAAIHKLGFPRSQIMMGVPFYGRSRKLADVTCTTDGCSLVSGLGLTSECVVSPALGQGTFPYFAINNDDFDEDVTGTKDSLANYAERLITSSGHVIDYETPASITEKARAATMLCTAGLAVFAVDQDNRNFDLTNAIWGGGALLPSAAEIVSTLKGEPLTADGLVSTDFWDQAADQILEHYPNLSMVLNYQVMILLAVRALDAVAASLYEYLKFSALTEDSFQLYKKWETKALNWALANEPITLNYTPTIPPDTRIQTTRMRIARLYQRDLRLGHLRADHGEHICGTQPFPLVRDLGSNATTEIPNIEFADAVPETNTTIIENSYIFEDDGTGRIKRRPTTKSSALASRHHNNNMPSYDPSQNSEGFSPYDPDEKCRTQWHNVLLVDGDKFFPNVKDGIQAFLDQYDEFKLTAVGVTNTTIGQTVESLSGVLYMALTTLVSGNDTLASTMSYIEQVKYDKALQNQYNALEKQAREAGIQLIIDIVLTLLSFVPFGGLASIAARTARALVPVFRSARVTQSLARGLERAFSGAMDARSIRAVDDLLSPTALAGRGKIGRALDRIQESSFLCEAVDFTGSVLDLYGLAEPFIPTAPLARRSDWSIGLEKPLDPPSIIEPAETWRNATALEPRHVAGNAVGSLSNDLNCIWFPNFESKYLKDDPTYLLNCHKISKDYPFKFVAEDGTVKTTTYTDCRPPAGSAKVAKEWKTGTANRKNNPGIPPNPRVCTCDHVLEANELVVALRSPWFAPNNGENNKGVDQERISRDEAKILCDQPEYRTFIQGLICAHYMTRPLNDKGDFDAADNPWKLAATGNDDVKAKDVAIMEEYMADVKDVRSTMAKSLDQDIQKLEFKDTKAQSILEKMKLGLRDFDTVGDGKPENIRKVGRMEEMQLRNERDYVKKLQSASFRTTPAVDTGSAGPSDPANSNNKRKGSPDSGGADTSCPPPKRSRKSITKID